MRHVGAWRVLSWLWWLAVFVAFLIWYRQSDSLLVALPLVLVGTGLTLDLVSVLAVRRDVHEWSPGDHQVVLESTGEKPIQVIKVLRELFDLDLLSAKQHIDRLPGPVGPPMSSEDAGEVIARLHHAGAAACIDRAQQVPPERTET